ncbi:SAGA-associated factor 29 isoform X2 [Alligator mississippiensis]|uniref:SAGA-associated factor 29 isoform X2 n=1 Tax=Alligator mississippiensis TaxID=8496 RepID=UPI002878075A|nr:SAGA-associated factor 29 isoform X2 [Alligator mississippiensis]
MAQETGRATCAMRMRCRSAWALVALCACATSKRFLRDCKSQAASRAWLRASVVGPRLPLPPWERGAAPSPPLQGIVGIQLAAPPTKPSRRAPRRPRPLPAAMALVSADSRIAELLGELHQLIKQTQEERSRSEHNLVNIQKTHERMQTENKISPYYRTKLRGLYTTAKADAEAECNILRKALDKIAEIKSLLEERRIAAKIAGLYNDSEPPRKTMRRGVLMTLLQQSAMTLPLWIGKPGEKPPPLCGAIPAASDYVAKPGDKVAARVKAVDGDEQWILAEVVSYSHATNKYEVDDIDEEGKERHTLSRRRIIPLPQWKANPETDPEALFQKDQLVLALYPQTTCFYRALIHGPPTRPQDDYSVLFEDTSYADGYSPPLNVAQRYVVTCKETKKK